MIKNKILDIKKYFKKIKNILNSQKEFCFTKYHKVIFKNCSQKLFSETITKRSLSF